MLHPGATPIHAKLDDFDEIEAAEDFLETVFAADLLRRHQIGQIKRRYSRTAKVKYLSNGCVHCDSLQGQYFDHEVWHDAKPAYAVEAELSDAWPCQLSDAYEEMSRWWFEESA